MEINAKKILEDINNKIRNRAIFKFNREFLVQSLIIASTNVQFIVFDTLNDLNLVDQVVSQFRTILKFIFSIDNINGTIPNNPNKTVDEFSKMIFEFANNYNPIRNYLDQCIIKTRNIKFDDKNKLYFEECYDDYSNYARTIDKVKEDPNEKLKQMTLDRIGKYLLTKNYKTNLFKDRYFYSLIDDYKKICRLDSEIKFEHDFGDFTYEEIISFCAALKIIADYYSLLIAKQPYPVIDYKTLIYGISKLASLSEEKVKLFIEYQTYDYEYQKDKLTLFQTLIRFGDNYYFYPMTLSIGLLPTKMYRLIFDHNKKRYEKDISLIAKKKEKQMTNEILQKFSKYDLTIKLNHEIKNGNINLAEYDMLAFDNKNNNLYIFEFKWYLIGDGEKEHNKIDYKMENDIKHRKEKNKYIFDDPEQISNQLFNGREINNIYEILISQNFCGNTRHGMCVIDFETLQWSIDRYDTFKDLMNYFLTGEFRNSIQVDTRVKDYEIEGYKFKIYCLVMKSS